MTAYEIAARAAFFASQRATQATVAELHRWERAARRSGNREHVKEIRREVRRIRATKRLSLIKHGGAWACFDNRTGSVCETFAYRMDGATYVEYWNGQYHKHTS
ncbi:hypothetical protein ACIBCT_35335 [Streptosporangium sp. NPDC050855]|uniref:hypothetical protein n=1 Tax=Streptosporangium sp. NPDC050855 TaxID=3366194 RepID=UPI0037B94C94